MLNWQVKQKYANLPIYLCLAVPLAAPAVSLKALGATSLKVEWDPLSVHDSRGQVTKHQVIYRKSGQPSQRVEDVPGTTSEYIITGKY